MEFLKKFNKIEELYNEIPVVKKRKERNFLLKTLRYLSTFVILACLLIFTYLAVHFFTFESIYSNLVSGKRKIEHSAQMIKQKKFDVASKYAEEARANFSEASRGLEKINNDFLVGRFQFIRSQIDEVVYLASTAEVLCRTAISMADVGQKVYKILGPEGITFSNLPKAKKREVLSVLFESTPELNGMRANVNLAINNIENMNFSGVLLPVKTKILVLHKYLKEAQVLLDDAVPMSQLMPSLLGFPEKSTFLIVMQNKDELRPTGGFIGTYGILETMDGDILRFDTHDIYHMDMPVKDLLSVSPPKPLIDFLGVDKWYMRDSNWSPDWPTAVEKIEWFYNEENKLLPQKNQINNFSGEFDGVIGVNTDLVADFLDIVGPIKIENEIYTSENFSDILEYRVEKDYIQLGIPSWQRKEVIGSIVEELKDRIMSKPITELYEAYNVLSSNLVEKNILVNFRDSEFQEIIEAKNWSGEVREADLDYLMVIDSNMAALKTDAVISRNIEYELVETVNGVFADVKINYSHNGNFDWRTTRYRTYTRVYVPGGAELIKTERSENEIDISYEHGKTVFGTFVSIEPQEVGTLHLYYKLPKNIEYAIDKNRYELLIQKQSGNNIESLEVNLEFIDGVSSYGPNGFYSSKNNGNVRWSTDLKVDKKFNVNLVE